MTRLPTLSRIRTPGSRRLPLLVVALALAAPAGAQTTGDLEGTVTETGGVPLPGVALEARSPSLQGTRLSVSDLLGRFRFPILPPGEYRISARLPSFDSQERSGVRVALGETTTLPITLVLSQKTAIEVSGETPLLDEATTRIGTSLTADEISRLPLGRNYASVASVIAGTGQDVVGITVYGATGLENQYIIDGLNTTGIRYGSQGKSLNAEFVQEVEVRTGGYEAEYGQVFGANINVITKSGGNEFHGGVFGYYDGEQLASANKHVSEQAAALQSQPSVPRRFDAGVDLGGYLLKDRLWFFGAYDRVASDQDYNRIEDLTFTPDGIQGTSKAGTDRTRMSLFSGKLTYRLGDSHTFAVSAFGDPGSLDGRLFDVVGPDSAALGQRSTGGTDLSAKWDGLFGAHFILQAQYGYHEEKNRESSDFFNDRPTIIQTRLGTNQFAAGSGPPTLADETYRRNVYKLAGSAFLGNHELRAGLLYERLNSSVSTRRNGGETINQVLDDETGAFDYALHFYYAKAPLNCIAKTDGSRGNFGFIDPTTCAGYAMTDRVSQTPRAGNLALFAQDSWKIAGNLTLNVGLRYEEQRIFDATGNPVIKLTGEWSPRVGAVWDPLRNGRSKVSASFGRYYQAIPQDIQIRSIGSEATVAVYNYTADRPDPIASPAFGYPAIIRSGDYVPPGVKGTYQDEVIAGFEYEFLKNWSIGVKGIYRALGRVIEDRCDIYDPRVQLQGQIPADSLATCAVMNVGEGAIGQIADPTNPDCFSDYPASTQPTPCESVKARRYFRGLQVDLQHRFADNFFLKASYLYSKLVGNYDGFVNELTGQTSPGENDAFDYIDLVPNNFGRLALDRTHQMKLSGSYSFPFGLQAGINSFVSSGAPLSILGWAPYGYNTERFLVPRGSAGELPWTYNIDLHLEYRIALGAVSLVPVIDVFNLTNVQQTISRDQVYNSLRNGNQSPPYTNPTNPTYGLDTAFQKPRLVRLGARVSF
jgi:hypothetical protein